MDHSIQEGCLLKISKRYLAIEKARICGYKNDKVGYTRLLVESKVKVSILQQSYSLGQKQAKAKMFD